MRVGQAWKKIVYFYGGRSVFRGFFRHFQQSLHNSTAAAWQDNDNADDSTAAYNASIGIRSAEFEFTLVLWVLLIKFPETAALAVIRGCSFSKQMQF